MALPSRDPDPDHPDLRSVIDEEVGRLPESWRAPFILCYLQGHSYEEAATRLRLPLGTVKSRLSRSRERLRSRLARRGLDPSGASPGAWFTTGASPTAVPAVLSAATVRAAASIAAGMSMAGAVPASVAALSKGVLDTMSLMRSPKLIGLALAVGAASTVVGALALSASRGQDPAPVPRRGAPAPVAATGEAKAKAKAKAKATGTATATEPPPVKSILTNGGFEDGGDAPDDWRRGADVPGVRYFRDETVAYKGKASLGLAKTVVRYFPIAQWSQEVPYRGKSPRLRVGAWVKADRMTKAILDVQFVDKGGDFTHGRAAYIGDKPESPPVTHDWTWYEGVVAIPEGTKALRVAPQIYGPGTVWFDEVVAEYTDAPATDPLKKFND